MKAEMIINRKGGKCYICDTTENLGLYYLSGRLGFDTGIVLCDRCGERVRGIVNALLLRINLDIDSCTSIKEVKEALAPHRNLAITKIKK